MASTTRVTLKVRILNGPACAFVFHVASSIVAPDNAVITGLIAVLEAITRGKVIAIEISLRAGSAGSATTGVPYVSEDKALMRFNDANGQAHTYKVPGLLEEILLSDRETIDPDNDDVEAYFGAVTGNAKTRAGDAITAFVSGHRVENRKPIKAGRVT